jgi:hypothetical protein
MARGSPLPLLMLVCKMALAGPVSYSLINTIQLPSVDIKSFSTTDSTLIVGGDEYLNDPVYVLSSSGQLITSYNTGQVVFSSAWDGSTLGLWDGYYLHTNYGLGIIGSYVYPDYFTTVGFHDGAWTASGVASGNSGTLTVVLNKFDNNTFASIGTESYAIQTSTAITSTPVYGIADHNGDLFLGLQGLNQLYEFSGSTLVQTIPIPTSFGPRGIGFIGADLFVADPSNSSVYELAPTSTPEPSTGAYLGFVTTFLFLAKGRHLSGALRRRIHHVS